jgi:phage baseplate assembly protein V
VNLNDLKRLLRPIQNKIFLLLGRAILAAVNNAEGTQKVQIVALEGETITDAERMQEYGLETYPLTDAEVTMIFLNGNRDHGLAICVHDRRYRPKDLTVGEVVLYTHEDKTTPFRFHLKSSRVAYLRADKSDIDVDTETTEDIGATKTVTVPAEKHENLTQCYINSPQVILGSDTWASVRRMIDSRFKDLFNDHVHSGVTKGNDNTGPPTTAIDEISHMTNYTRAI